MYRYSGTGWECTYTFFLFNTLMTAMTVKVHVWVMINKRGYHGNDEMAKYNVSDLLGAIYKFVICWWRDGVFHQSCFQLTGVLTRTGFNIYHAEGMSRRQVQYVTNCQKMSQNCQKMSQNCQKMSKLLNFITIFWITVENAFK